MGYRLDPRGQLLTYEQGVEAFRITDRLSDSEKTALMGETLSEDLQLVTGQTLTSQAGWFSRAATAE